MTTSTATTGIAENFAAVAVALHDREWRPLPVQGKAPILPGWNVLCAMPWDRDDLIAATQEDYANIGYGCGLAADTEHVIIDIDVLDEQLAADIGTVADQLCGPTPLVRIGRAPKSARIYRSQARTIRTSMARPIQALSGSMQLVAFGAHPDIGEPYRWIAGYSPLTLPADSLEIPKITSAQLQQFLAAAHGLLTRAHYVGDGHPGRPRRQAAGAAVHDVHQQLRIDAMRLGFERAAIEMLENADHEGVRDLALFAMVSSAAGRGWSEERIVHKAERYFRGWDGVSDRKFNAMLNTCFPQRDGHG
jgi:hypothetical protein